MNKILIEKATKKDSTIVLSFIKGLAKHVEQSDLVTATTDMIKHSLFTEDSPAEAQIAYCDSVPAGFMLYYKTYSTFSAKFGYYIEDLFVFPEFRGKGIGTKLFRHIIRKSRSENCVKVEWYVNNKNAKAIEFYANLGAKQLDYKSIYYIKTDT